MEQWQNPKTITIWILIIAIVLILLLAFITLLIRLVFKKITKRKISEAHSEIIHQQELLKANIAIQENERRRIASDLHDSLISKLVAIKMYQENDSDVSNYSNLIDISIKMVREISHDLSPPLLEYSSLNDLIKEIITPLNLNYTIITKFDQRYFHDYTSDFKLQILRIFQETLNNIIKHAEATTIIIHFRDTSKKLFFKINDNGKGFNIKNNETGLGLKNIQSRVQYLNGHFKLKSKLSFGTTSIFIFKKTHI